MLHRPTCRFFSALSRNVFPNTCNTLSLHLMLPVQTVLLHFSALQSSLLIECNCFLLYDTRSVLIKNSKSRAKIESPDSFPRHSSILINSLKNASLFSMMMIICISLSLRKLPKQEHYYYHYHQQGLITKNNPQTVQALTLYLDF